MIALLLGLALLGVGVLLFRWGDQKYTDFREACSFGGFLLGASGVVVTVIVFLALVFQPITTRSQIARFEAVRTTVEDARTAKIGLESAAIQLKVAEMNEWLASTQYYNHHPWFKDFIPDEVDAIEPIK